MLKFDIFPNIPDMIVRRNLQFRLLHCTRILTFQSFHRDTILLEACYRPLRDIFEPPCGTTLRNACKVAFADDMRTFNVKYIQLWIYVVRHFASLTNEQQHWKAMSRLGEFSASCGFTNFGIAKKFSQDIGLTTGAPVVSGISPALSRNEDNVPAHNRCSRPRRSDFEGEWQCLSFSNVYCLPDQAAKLYPTAYAVARDIVRCFLEFEQAAKALDSIDCSASCSSTVTSHYDKRPHQLHNSGRNSKRKKSLEELCNTSSSKKRLITNSSSEHAESILQGWKPLTETVRALGNNLISLSDAHIYMTSSVSVAELDSQLHSKEPRLYAWSKAHEDKFDRQMRSLLGNDFTFNVISFGRDMQISRSPIVDHMEYWSKCSRQSHTGILLGTLIPKRRVGGSS